MGFGLQAKLVIFSMDFGLWTKINDFFRWTFVCEVKSIIFSMDFSLWAKDDMSHDMWSGSCLLRHWMHKYMNPK